MTGPGFSHCPLRLLPSADPARLPAPFLGRVQGQGAGQGVTVVLDCVNDERGVAALLAAAAPEG